MAKSSKMKKQNRMLVFVLLAAMVAIAAIGIFFKEQGQGHRQYALTAKQKIDGSVLPKPRDIQAFQLQGTNGKPFTQANLQGHWSLLFFGYTNCPMVCPTTMTELTKMYHQLQKDLPAKALPQVVLVSVDPERDSMSRLKEYVGSFDGHFMGARGDLSAVKKLTNQLSVVFKKVVFDESDPGHYAVTHSAEVMLVNPEGQLVAFMSYPHKALQMVKDYELITRS